MDCLRPPDTTLITMESFLTVFQGCPELRRLELHSVHEETLDQIDPADYPSL